MGLDAARVAVRQAADDRALLARLRASGDVLRRHSEQEDRHPEVTRPFIADIERRAAAMRPGANTIRPNKKKAKSRKRR